MKWANELAREWMETGDPHGDFQTASLLFGLIDDPDQFARFGESFGDNGKGYMRLSYAASEAEIREALKRMKTFIEG